MSQSPQQELPLARVAGGAAVVAGALFAVAQLGQLATLDRADIIATTADPLFRAFSIAYAAGSSGWSSRSPPSTCGRRVRWGSSASSASGAAVLGTMSLGADMWFEAFCLAVAGGGDAGRCSRSRSRRSAGRIHGRASSCSYWAGSYSGQ